MDKRAVLTRSIGVALGVILVTSLGACSKGANPSQATNQPANLALTTSAAASQLPPPAGGSMPNQGAPATGREGATAQAMFATVVAVKPLTQSSTTSSPHQVCNEEQVQVPKNYKDQHQIGGAVVGGLAGALLGHQVGGGKGKTLATIAGAAGGAFAGHEIQKKHQEKNATETETKNVCHTVTDKTTKTTTVGYDVTYTLNGKTGHIRMDHNPGVGVGLPVQNGQVVATRKQTGNYYQ